jgi:hypothetical protein
MPVSSLRAPGRFRAREFSFVSNPLDSIDTMIPARLSPADAVTLSRALLLAFDGEKGVDAASRKAGRALRDASDSLRVAWEANVRAAIASDRGASARRADFDEDAVWIALHLWLKGWATLPGHLAPERDIAQAVLDALFPDGTSFTQLTYALEWAEADRKLAVLEAEGHAARIESLGGGAILRAVRAAHLEYESVLGMSHRATLPPEPASDALAPMIESVRDALDAYVRTVVSATDRSNPTSVARAESLLVPLRRWASDQLARTGGG